MERYATATDPVIFNILFWSRLKTKKETYFEETSKGFKGKSELKTWKTYF